MYTYIYRERERILTTLLTLPCLRSSSPEVVPGPPPTNLNQGASAVPNGPLQREHMGSSSWGCYSRRVLLVMGVHSVQRQSMSKGRLASMGVKLSMREKTGLLYLPLHTGWKKLYNRNVAPTDNRIRRLYGGQGVPVSRCYTSPLQEVQNPSSLIILYPPKLC